MGWIENVALTTAALVHGASERMRLIRRSIIRYLVLSQVLVFRDISISVRRRFPTLRSLVSGGFLQEHELKMLEDVKIDEKYNKYWVPINWACALCLEPADGKPVGANPNNDGVMQVSHLNYLLNEIKFFRNNLQTLCSFDWVPIPLAYPQVIFLAVRVYFGICVVGRQFIVGNDPKNEDWGKKSLELCVDMYFPMMTVFEFIFLVGWMKVAEALLNPFGEDDDDFEMNFLIDKNIATGLAIVDDDYKHYPDLFMDKFKTNQAPVYSEDSKKNGNNNVLAGSAAHVTLAEPNDDVKMVEIPPVSSAPSMVRKGPRHRSISVSVANSLSNSPNLTVRGFPLPYQANSVINNNGTLSRFNSSNISRPPSTDDRPFELSFNPTFLKNDVVHEVDHEVDEEGSAHGVSNPEYKPHHIASRISEVSEEDKDTETTTTTTTENNKSEPSRLEEIPEHQPFANHIKSEKDKDTETTTTTTTTENDKSEPFRLEEIPEHQPFANHIKKNH
ncbi:unnamed protein product, partial [Mesorhabditis belari]|uniref:Bestrophin homolog n=1 Tax=Mesorhabditis belari TaxID=2138241 RepID=A0AAF3FR01_9BILA